MSILKDVVNLGVKIKVEPKMLISNYLKSRDRVEYLMILGERYLTAMKFIEDRIIESTEDYFDDDVADSIKSLLKSYAYCCKVLRRVGVSMDVDILNKYIKNGSDELQTYAIYYGFGGY